MKKKIIKVLCACEESQTVTKALRDVGVEAYSCDIRPCSGGHDEWHIRGDALRLLKGGVFETEDGLEHYVKRWDAIIAFPPCTYLSSVGTRHLYPNGVLNQERYKKGVAAAKFFMKFIEADVDMVCVENPQQFKIFNLPPCTQRICPSMFGHKEKKRTLLWLKNLPELKPTKIIKDAIPTTHKDSFYQGKNRKQARSKFFSGVAEAMATQWFANEKHPIPV